MCIVRKHGGGTCKLIFMSYPRVIVSFRRVIISFPRDIISFPRDNVFRTSTGKHFPLKNYYHVAEWI